MIKTYLKYFLRRSFKYHLIKNERQKALDASLDYILGLGVYYYFGIITFISYILTKIYGYHNISLNKYDSPIEMVIFGLMSMTPFYLLYKKYKKRMIIYLEHLDLSVPEKKMSLFIDFLLAFSTISLVPYFLFNFF